MNLPMKVLATVLVGTAILLAVAIVFALPFNFYL